MSLPRFPGDKRCDDSVPEMETPRKKLCVRSEKDNKYERRDIQQNDVTQSSSCGDQMYDIIESPTSENQRCNVIENQHYDVTESPPSEDEEPDFSLLPPHVWVTVMSNLEERDRLALGLTCKILNYYKADPILWRSAVMHLGNLQSRQYIDRAILSCAEISVLQSHSCKIQNLKIVTENLRRLRFSRRSIRILDEAVTNLSLKKMVLDCSGMEGVDIRPGKPIVHDVGRLIRKCLTSERAKGLEELGVLCCTWTSGNKKGSFVLELLKAAPFTDSLKQLALGSFRNPAGRSNQTIIKQVIESIGRFKNLQLLTIRIMYLSDQLLETLSSSMTRLFTQINLVGSFSTFQEAITKWPQLLSSCPDLKVSLGVMDCLNRENTLAAIPPIVPVSCVKVESFTDTDEHNNRRELLQLLPAYSRTLTTLRWCDESDSDHDSDLIDTVKCCSKLVNLLFNGRINSSSINTLACLRVWQSLKFLARSIIFPESKTETQAQQMSKLKTAVCKRLGHTRMFANTLPATDSEESQRNCPLSFKFDRQPLHL